MDPLGAALGIVIGLILTSIFVLAQLKIIKLFQICRGLWPFHVWSKWGAPYNGTQTRQTGNFGETRTYPVVVQSRWCTRCGAAEHRIENVDVKLAELARALGQDRESRR